MQDAFCATGEERSITELLCVCCGDGGGSVCPLGVKDWVTSALASFSEAVEKEYQSMCLELSVHLLSIF